MPEDRNTAVPELDRYIELTNLIRELSSPQVMLLQNEDDYRKCLIENFSTIGSYAKENNAVLNRFIWPYIHSDLSPDDITKDVLGAFLQKLYNIGNLYTVDIPLAYRLARSLLRDTEKTSDDNALVRALSGMAQAAYYMSIITANVYPECELGSRCCEEGWAAGQALLGYLEKGRFEKLGETEKALVLINSRFMHILLLVTPLYSRSCPQRTVFSLRYLENSLQLSEDPFYREQLPSFDWDRLNYRTLEYISGFTEKKNALGFEREDLEQIYRFNKRFEEMDRRLPQAKEFSAQTHTLPIFLSRNAYLTGRLDLESYKQTLRDIIEGYLEQDFSQELPTAAMVAPIEYILLLDKNDLSPKDAAFLKRYYAWMIDYIHHASKTRRHAVVLSYTSAILTTFIDVPGELSFWEMCLSAIAALHPPTHIHTLSVAAFSACITRHLLQKQPELLLGVLGLETTEELLANAPQIENYVYHAGIIHDFGKLLIADIIGNYRRSLMAEEMELIRSHPAVGAALLRQHPDTMPYADIALGHHRWYNNGGGYPENFDLANHPLKNVISIITCADCLDAATDSVGRSYKEGKALDRFLEELRTESGTRYAPWLYDLFEDKALRTEIETLLEQGRDDNYRKTYRILKGEDGIRSGQAKRP